MALLSTSVLWDGVGVWTGVPLWGAMSFWTLVAGLVAVLPAAATGFMDYAQLPVGTPAERTARQHLMVTGGAVTAFLLSLLVRGEPGSLSGVRLVGALLCSGLGLALLAVGGHLGGILVYRHGVGQKRETKTAPDRSSTTAGDAFPDAT